MILLLVFFAAPQTAEADKAERLQEEISELQRDIRAKTTELTKAKAEISKATTEPLKAEAKQKVEMLTAELAALKDDLRQLRTKADREEEARVKKENCVECNKPGEAKHKGKNGWDGFADIVKAATPLGLGAMNLYGGIKAMNQQSSDYQLYANTMSANGLPFSQNTNSYSGMMSSFMGMNGMSGFGSMGMNGQSSFGGMNMGGMNMMGGMNSFQSMGGLNMLGGMGYGNMMGGYNPYASMMGSYNPYGGMMSSYNPYAATMSSYNPYGAMAGYGTAMSAYNPYGAQTSYNPYASGYGNYSGYSNGSGFNGYSSVNPWSSNVSSGYNSSLYGSQYRTQQQYSITSADAQLAAQSLSEAQQRYNQALGTTYNTGSYNYGTYNTGTYNSGYYGSTYSNTYSPYNYYGTTTTTPANNGYRQ